MIHYSNPQSRGMRTQILLDTFNIPHQFEMIDFKKGENKTDSYLEIHPYGRVPALVDEGQNIVESGAITLYLADKYADKMGTPPVGTPERALMYQWLFFLQATLEPVAMEFFTKQKNQQEATDKVRELLGAMSGKLGSPFVLGERFTFLDATLACELYWYKLVGILPDDLTRYNDFLVNVAPKLSKNFGGTRPD